VWTENAAAQWVTSRPDTLPPAVTVLPFEAVEADSAAAARAKAMVEEALRARGELLLVPNHPAERPPFARRAGRESPLPVRYMVAGSVKLDPDHREWTHVRLFDVETTHILVRDSAQGDPSNLAHRFAVATARIAAATPSPYPFGVRATTTDAVPSLAVMAYSRGVLALDRGDSAAALRHLERALQLHPRFGRACEDLRRLRPEHPCEPR
jgi:hypothetical protein